jgi:hypothetical protein
MPALTRRRADVSPSTGPWAPIGEVGVVGDERGLVHPAPSSVATMTMAHALVTVLALTPRELARVRRP